MKTVLIIIALATAVIGSTVTWRSIVTTMNAADEANYPFRKTNTNQNKNNSMKPVQDVYTVFLTRKLEETVNFYETYFGFTKIFESTFFVLLQSEGEQKFNVAFMDEGHPTSPPTPRVFNGDGAFLTLQVADAAALFEILRKEGLKIAYPLTDEPWGQRRFAVVDPNGLWVDVVEQTEPAPGYWDKYIKQ